MSYLELSSNVSTSIEIEKHNLEEWFTIATHRSKASPLELLEEALKLFWMRPRNLYSFSSLKNSPR